MHTEWISFTHLNVDRQHVYLAKINAHIFMLEDFYLEILAEFNIVVKDHCHYN